MGSVPFIHVGMEGNPVLCVSHGAGGQDGDFPPWGHSGGFILVSGVPHTEFSSLDTRLADLCGSEWFIPPSFAAMLFIQLTLGLDNVGLALDLFDLSSDSSCCPRCISSSKWPRCSTLEENSGGKPIPGGLQWLWEEHPKEPWVLVGVRGGKSCSASPGHCPTPCPGLRD